jgi:hypothetical protein
MRSKRRLQEMREQVVLMQTLKDTKIIAGFVARLYADGTTLLIEVSQQCNGFKIVATKAFKSSVGREYFNQLSERNLQRYFNDEGTEIKINLKDE